MTTFAKEFIMDKNNLPEGFTYCNITDIVNYDCDGVTFSLSWEGFVKLMNHPRIKAYEATGEGLDELAKLPVKD